LRRKTRLSNPIPVKQNLEIQIHHKGENPPVLNPNPCSSLVGRAGSVGDHERYLVVPEKRKTAVEGGRGKHFHSCW